MKVLYNILCVTISLHTYKNVIQTEKRFKRENIPYNKNTENDSCLLNILFEEE